MKKLAMLLGTLLFALSMGAQGATNATTFCIDFVNFCDGMQLKASDTQPGMLNGAWHSVDCAGHDAAVHGAQQPGKKNVTCDATQTGCPSGLTWYFAFNMTTGTFNMFGFDGVNPPFPQQLNQPFTMTAGACTFSEKTGIPSHLRN
jgi:hypothetical protein